MSDLRPPWKEAELRHGRRVILDRDGHWVGDILPDFAPTVLAAPTLAARCERLLEALQELVRVVQYSARESFATSEETFEQDYRAEVPEEYAAFSAARAAIAEAEEQT